MSHKIIHINNLESSFANRIFFRNFTYQLNFGSRISIIGRNGCGKSTLLQILAGRFEPTNGTINISQDVIIGYVPQIIEEYNHLSSGEQLNKMITQALNLNPDILFLDEPTNHFDETNRKNFMRLLQHYAGTLIIVSHDITLMEHTVDTFWHIEDEKINTFSGRYLNYISKLKMESVKIERDISQLNRLKKDMHDKLMHEQQKVAKSRAKGKKNIINRKWPKMIASSKAMKAEKHSGRKLRMIDHTKQELTSQLAILRLPEIIVPTFSINSNNVTANKIIQISERSVGYESSQLLLSDINLSIFGTDRLAITGDNGSGKSTLIKAIMGDKSVFRQGSWFTPQQIDTGYLNQNYINLDSNCSVFEVISNTVPHWSQTDIRQYLSRFLFRKNEQINIRVKNLSGGEKARLSLAQISINTPQILILDEVTNNLDLETKMHVIQVLKAYPGALIVISHDNYFLEMVNIQKQYNIEDHSLSHRALNVVF